MAAPDRSADLAAVQAGIDATNRGDLDAAMEPFHPELEFHIAPGLGERHVVVDAHQVGRGHGSGIEVAMQLGYMFELRDGKVVRFHVLHARDSAVAAAEAGERAEPE